METMKMNDNSFVKYFKAEGNKVCTDDLEKREICTKECTNTKCKNNEKYYKWQNYHDFGFGEDYSTGKFKVVRFIDYDDNEEVIATLDTIEECREYVEKLKCGEIRYVSKVYG